jgi:hypothetical protein
MEYFRNPWPQRLNWKTANPSEDDADCALALFASLDFTIRLTCCLAPSVILALAYPDGTFGPKLRILI